MWAHVNIAMHGAESVSCSVDAGGAGPEILNLRSICSASAQALGLQTQNLNS